MDTRTYYATRFGYNASREKVWRAITHYLKRYIRDTDNVLDLGCGYGDFINNVSSSGKFAIDLNPEMAEFLSPTIKFSAQSALDSFDNCPSSSLDVVFASNLLEHFDDGELSRILDNVKRALKKEGKLVLMQPNYYYAYREYWDDYTHKKAFSHISIVDFVVSKGFVVENVEKRFLPFSLKSKLPKSYWLTRIYLASNFRPFAKQMLAVFKLK